MADENQKQEVEIEKLERDEKELTAEEQKEVKGGLKMAPARSSQEEQPQTPGI